MLIEGLTVLLIFVTILMAVCIFLQRPEANSFTSGAAETLSNILSARSSKNPLARITAILATLFFVLCLTIAVLTRKQHSSEALVGAISSDAPAEVAPTSESKTEEDKSKAQSSEKKA